MPPERDPHLAVVFICVLFALACAVIQLVVNTGRPPRDPDGPRGPDGRPRLPPGEYPIFPAF
jgi:hypothetical protein